MAWVNVTGQAKNSVSMENKGLPWAPSRRTRFVDLWGLGPMCFYAMMRVCAAWSTLGRLRGRIGGDPVRV